MKNLFLAILATFTLSACSTVQGAGDDISTAFNSITGTSSSQALKDYTSIIEKHSHEKWANYSYKTVELCHIKPGGMTEDELIERIQKNYDNAQACWNGLVDYPTKDVRFYKEGSIEKEILVEFEEVKDKLTALFINN